MVIENIKKDAGHLPIWSYPLSSRQGMTRLVGVLICLTL